MKPVVSVVMLLLIGAALAHDLITAESAEVYLSKAIEWSEKSNSNAANSQRAEAYLRIGIMLDEIRGLLNRDLAVHGKVQGLASNYLVAELARAGTPLAFSGSSNYFTPNSKYYRSALELGLNGVLAREARLQLLRGEFYDSFGVDPLDTSQTDQQLREQLVLVDALIPDVTSEPDREELRFIATIVYARAARTASQVPAGSVFRDKALALAAAFERDYPDSLRSAAMPVIREALRTTPQVVAD